MKYWLTLIVSLPTENATVRMRVWRTLKASGAHALRDGVYLLPEREDCRAVLDTLENEIRSAGGAAHLLRVVNEDNVDFPALFNRSENYHAMQADIAQLQALLTASTALDTLKQSRKLRKALAAIADIDFFPGQEQSQAHAALEQLERNIQTTLSPDEPNITKNIIVTLDKNLYRGRTWATRRRPWVDRLASAWLIRNYIDPQARFIWLASPADCPDDALGFDFDGATFTHVDNLVTFEVLLASFALQEPELQKLSALVHYLDVGGIAPNDAAGVEQILAGLRATLHDDEQLLEAASHAFKGLAVSYQKEAQP